MAQQAKRIAELEEKSKELKAKLQAGKQWQNQEKSLISSENIHHFRFSAL